MKAKANALQGIPEMFEIADGNVLGKILEKNTPEMLQMAGIGMIYVLCYLFIMLWT